jgi:hypothetical protein
MIKTFSSVTLLQMLIFYRVNLFRVVLVMQ